MDLKEKFIAGVLGTDGARALKKAATRSSQLGNALLPRTIMAWLQVATRFDYEGELPGVENSYINFQKNENGSLSGSISIDDEIYQYENSSMYHVASAIAVSLGADNDRLDPTLKDIDIARLGKSIDLLAKAHVVTNEIAKGELEKKVLDPGAGYQFSHEHHDLGAGSAITKVNVHSPEGHHVGTATFNHTPHGLQVGTVVVDEDHQRRGIASHMYGMAEKLTGKKVLPSSNQTEEGAALWAGNKQQPQFGLGKVEAPGSPVRHEQKEAIAQQAPRRKATKLPRPTKQNLGQTVEGNRQAPMEAVGPRTKFNSPQTTLKSEKTLRISKAQSLRKCNICERRQFQDDKFVGCLCFRELSKSTHITVIESGYQIDFGRDWDPEAISVFFESLRLK